jgi:oligopeptide/dipeptide ABC transporter ATP-binding protein
VSLEQSTSVKDAVLSAEQLTLYISSGGSELKVVDNVSFQIKRGEFFALVGESGSGKTVIARSIMRLYPRSFLKIEGRLQLEGFELATAEEPALRKLRGSRMSMIFQEPMSSLNPLMTVEAQIAESLRTHNKEMSARNQRERVLELLANVQFADPTSVARMYPFEMSGGMRQRTMIAIALANNPSLLIADEPTTALDVTIQREIMDILVKLQASHNLSVLFISHNLSLVRRYADKVGVLYGGVMMEQGDTQKIISHPSHPYTRALLDCAPRFRVPGTRQAGIAGTVPRIDTWFDGCRFAPRCPKSEAICREGSIPVVSTGQDSWARCHFPS